MNKTLLPLCDQFIVSIPCDLCGDKTKGPNLGVNWLLKPLRGSQSVRRNNKFVLVKVSNLWNRVKAQRVNTHCPFVPTPVSSKILRLALSCSAFIDRIKFKTIASIFYENNDSSGSNEYLVCPCFELAGEERVKLLAH